MSESYYDKNHTDFALRAAKVDMSGLQNRFMEALPPPARILDAGCGPGRDSKAFIDAGYDVVAMDASGFMVVHAKELIKQDVHQLRFQDIEFEDEFDGIWASASLLHVPICETHDVYARFIWALRSGGIWYLSYKLGQGEREEGGRLFVDHTEESLLRLLGQYPELRIVEMWVAPDVRPERTNEFWTNCLLVKNPEKSVGNIGNSGSSK